jgi:hypothetical protein
MHAICPLARVELDDCSNNIQRTVQPEVLHYPEIVIYTKCMSDQISTKKQ